MRPRSALFFLAVGVVLWTVITAASLVTIVVTPGDHSGLALGLLLIWVVLIVFAAFARVTEHIGGRPR